MKAIEDNGLEVENAATVNPDRIMTDREAAQLELFPELKLREEAQPAPIFTLQITADEALAVYDALRFYLRLLGQQDDQPLNLIKTVIGLMHALKPGVVDLAQAIKK